MRDVNRCVDSFKGPKFAGPLPQPGWLDRVKNYPDIDKKRLGPCQGSRNAGKKPL